MTKPRRDVDRVSSGGRIVRECKICLEWRRRDSEHYYRRADFRGRARWGYICKVCDLAKHRAKREGAKIVTPAVVNLPPHPPPVMAWCWWEPSPYWPPPERKRP